MYGSYRPRWISASPLFHYCSEVYNKSRPSCRPRKLLWEICSDFCGIMECKRVSCCFSFIPFSCVCFFFFSRSLNELRVLLLESHRHSRDMEKDLSREVHKAEWKVKEQKLQEDIKTLREKLLLLVRTEEFVF